jgi:hypothetical protein
MLTSPPGGQPQSGVSGHDPERALIRHSVATLAYRARKAVHGAPDGFADFRASPTSRPAGKILSHMCDLFDWALTMAKGATAWRDTAPQTWDVDCVRFFDSLARFDDYLASDAPLVAPASQLMQGPIADALTHTGQITMMRRMAGGPVRGESYARAEIVIGRVGSDQAPPRFEFD